MSTTQVFLGPSLSWAEARSVLPGAVLRPPARAGDVYTAVRRGAAVIAIVDGYFERVPSVWHKEVLYALSRGVHVFGAASMGALRAAELHPFGMVGIGRIFEWYRDGICTDDDEVAVVHGPRELDFKPASEAMVNIRDALAHALGRGLIGVTTHDTIVREMKRRHYPERTWLLVPEIARQAGLKREEVDALIEFVETGRPNRKRLDTLELLARLRPFAHEPPALFQPQFDFESTVFWDQLVSSVRTAPAAGAGVPIEALRSHVGVVEDDAHAIFEGALLLYLVVKEAQRIGLQVDGERVERTTDRFCREHGLLTAADLESWKERNALGHAEFEALMEVLALVEVVARHHTTGLDAFLPVELHRRGRFAAVTAAIDEKQQVLERFGLAVPSAEDVGTTTDALLAWYEERFRKMDVPLDEHCEDRRVANAARFVREVLSEYLREEHRRESAVSADA